MPDIVITPNRGTTSNPKIDFTGVTAGTIKLEVLADGTIAWNGANGSLFSIADSLSGSLMSVNDISGLPAFEVFSDNRVVIGQFGANLLLGKTTNSSNGRLQLTTHTTNAGGIGFGTDTSIYRSATNVLTIEASSGVVCAGGFLSNLLTNSSGATMTVGTSTANSLVLRTNSTAALTFDSSQIGTFASRITVNGATIASAGSIQVTSADAALRLKSTTSPVADKNTWDIRSVGTGATPYLQFRTVNDANTVFTDRVAFTNDGNVGIGTTTPTSKLSVVTGGAEISGTANTNGYLLEVKGTAASGGFLPYGNNVQSKSYWAMSNALTVGSAYSATVPSDGNAIFSGNVGIGTTSPASKLHISGSSGTIISITDNTLYSNSITNANAVMTYTVDTGNAAAGSAAHIFKRYATELVRIDQNGNVGIGVTAPAYKLDVAGTANTIAAKIGAASQYLTIGSYTPNSAGATLGYNTIQYLGLNAFFGVLVGRTYVSNTSTAPADGMAIQGNLGVGTTAPGGKLEVNFTAAAAATALILRTSDSAGNGAIRWQNSAGTNQAGIGSSFNVADTGAIEFLNGATTNVIFRSSGNVGIATNSPNYKLEVSGDAYVTAALKVGNVETRSFTVSFSNAVANRATDIRFPNTSINGLIEIEVTSGFDNQNSVGVVKKIFSVGANANNSIWNTTVSRVVEAHGAAADNWTIGDFAWDATNSKYIIPIYHIVSNGNVLNINVRYFSQTAISAPVLPTTTASAEYTATIPAAYQVKHYVYYNDRVGVGTSAPSALFQVGSAAVGNFKLDSNGSGGHYYQAESNPRLGFGRDLVTSAGHISFTMGGGSVATLGSAITMPANSQLGFYTSNGTSLVERMRIDGSGNVGIGTTTPSTLLHIAGNATFSGYITSPSNGAGAGSKLLIQGSSGTGQAGATGGNGHIEILGAGTTSLWTSFSVGAQVRRRGGILIQTGTAAGDASATYVHGSNFQVTASNATNNGTSTGTGGSLFFNSGGTTLPSGVINNGASLNMLGGTTASAASINILGGSTSGSTGTVLAAGNVSITAGGVNDTLSSITGAAVNVTGGSNDGAGKAGNVNITGGSYTGTSAVPSAGDVVIAGGFNQSLTAGLGGNVIIKTGNANINGGKILLQNSGGNTYFTLENSGNAYFSGYVGIGVSNPIAQLHIAGVSGTTSFTGSTGLGIRISGSASTNDYSGLDFATLTGAPRARIASYFSSSGSYLTFGTSNDYSSGITNSAMTIDYSGNVGVGTTSPAYKLDVSGSIADSIGNIRILPQNSRSAAYTTVLSDSGKHILHPSADTTARTFTIDSNTNVAYPIGTAITFINQNGAGVVTIAITSDTMRLAGAGTNGSRTLAANGVATAVKITSTEWIISGTGLT